MNETQSNSKRPKDIQEYIPLIWFLVSIPVVAAVCVHTYRLITHPTGSNPLAEVPATVAPVLNPTFHDVLPFVLMVFGFIVGEIGRRMDYDSPLSWPILLAGSAITIFGGCCVFWPTLLQF